MTTAQIITLVVAILGVLHGPLVQQLFTKSKNSDNGK